MKIKDLKYDSIIKVNICRINENKEKELCYSGTVGTIPAEYLEYELLDTKAISEGNYVELYI